MTDYLIAVLGTPPYPPLANPAIIDQTGQPQLTRLIDAAAIIAVDSGNLVWQPGGVAGGNVFTTWATLAVALQSIEGKKTVTVDTSLAAAHITTGTWTGITDVTFVSGVNSITAVVTIDDGAHFATGTGNSNRLVFDGVSFVNASTTAPFISLTGTQNLELLFINAATWNQGGGATKPFVDVGGSAVLVGLSNASQPGGNSGVYNLSTATATAAFVLFDASTMNTNAVGNSSGGAPLLEFTLDGASQPLVSTTQGQAPSVTVADPMSAYVFKPGATGFQDGNVFTTWAALALVLAATNGPKVVGVNTAGGAAHITTGTWSNVNNVTFVADGSTAIAPTLTVDAGARLPNMTQMTLDSVALVYADAAAACIQLSSGTCSINLRNNASVSQSGGQPLVALTGTAAFQSIADNLSTWGATTVNMGAAGVVAAFKLFDGAGIASGAVAGGLGTLTFVIDGASQAAPVSATQSPAPTIINADPQPTFVLRPGGTAGGNVYTSWATLYAAASQSPGKVIVLVDNSAGTCHVTAGAYNIDQWEFWAQNTSTSTTEELIIDAGATFTFTTFESHNVAWMNANNTSPPMLGTATGAGFKLYGGSARSTVNAPMIQVATGNVFVVTLLEGASLSQPAANPVIQTDAGAVVSRVIVYDNSAVNNNTLSGTGTAIIVYAVEAIFSTTQTVTTLTLTPLDVQNLTQASGNSGTGTGTVTVTTGNIQQKKSGKVLVIANVAGTTSAGTTVTLQLVRDAATNIGNPIVETTLSAGDGFHGSIAFVDTLPDAAVHTYKCTATAGAGNITPGGANSAQISAVEL
jgi:hypothetical protein